MRRRRPKAANGMQMKACLLFLWTVGLGLSLLRTESHTVAASPSAMGLGVSFGLASSQGPLCSGSSNGASCT